VALLRKRTFPTAVLSSAKAGIQALIHNPGVWIPAPDQVEAGISRE